MKLSYWEYKTWLSTIDFTIIGSGIVGLNCALQLQTKYPKAKILILERGILPQGASTKNAGFACFGSISEILSDLKTHTEDEVYQLVQKRWEGIHLLRKNLGDKEIGFKNLGGHEIFTDQQEALYEACLAKIEITNSFLNPIFKGHAFKVHANTFNFKKIQNKYITNVFESQIDTGKMMAQLLRRVQSSGVMLLNSLHVESFVDLAEGVAVKTNEFEFTTKKLIIATNGFGAELLGEEIKPARAQVLITKPIQNLKIKGAFHLDEGYYYFRNIDDRILLGGGRNLDFNTEETTSFGETAVVQNKLETLLKEVIAPEYAIEIDQRWSGIMGVGPQKRPIVKQVSNHVYCGIRMGGMGIAIGSIIGKELADLV
ncbi:FAD dependent oxidoreductase [Cellulophaga algicola DSM 14237]|uniref:FAD dependent oxidoreductase n=1 Tax=Cellulophaga algicola (strain DSM 14237 / IC166 / ACAM 630) TaxID=688270 RepID=E6X8Q1_CELAD|nr:FAD-dependent oxidoreductase [Cellulophaga algicola]ADV48646.1 FAD dependent oxidoreductase [Cellulophaga algicola DSM 14237]